MKLKHFLLTALLLFLGVSGVYAGRKYVGFGSGGGYTNTQLQNALNDAGTGDTVFVAVGLYIATDSAFLVPANVTLIGGYDKGDATAATRRYPGQFVPFDSSNLSTTTKFTILDGNSYKRTLPADKHRVVRVEKNGVVDGCLIRNGHVRNGNGGGVLLNGGKLYNSIVRGNVAMNHPDSAEALGGGVFIQEGGELINCLVAYNMANDGYGVAAGKNGGKMINNTITANTYSPVFAKIPGGAFKMYAGSKNVYSRKPAQDWPNGEIPKWSQTMITLSDFYISRILTTEGQYAVFCAAMDIPITTASGVTYGDLNTTDLKNLIDPLNGGTIENRHKFGTVTPVQQHILRSITDENLPGLRLDDGVWHPVVDTVTVEYPVDLGWYGALAYSVWLGGVLPTEAQWEFAARREPNGTVNDNLYSGAYGSADPSSIAVNENEHPKDTITWRILDSIAWVHRDVSMDTAGSGYKTEAKWGANRPHEIARKRPNAMGIYDMTGNVMEWCGDQYNDAIENFPYTSFDNPIYNTGTSPYRMIRGGIYNSSNRRHFSLAYRDYWNRDATNGNIGVRPVVAF